MLIKVSNDRSIEIEEENFGTQNENRIETLSFELPEEYSNFTKKIVFITNDGNYWDLIEEDNTYILKNNITKFRKFYAYVWLVNLENNVDFRSKVFKIELNKNENPDDYTPSEEQISGFDTMMQELNEAIEEVKQLPSLKYEIVEELPTEDIDTHTIYLILREKPEGNNYYDEYLYINNSWEKIGSTDVDLSDLIDDIENLENRVFSERNVKSESNTLILENTEEDMGLEVSEIDGWTEQETTNGYQLIDPSTIETGTKNGITLSQTNGIITISGTATGYTSFNINVGEITGDKYLSCDNWGSFTIYTQYNGSGVASATQNVTFSYTIDKLVIGITSGTTINKTIKLMLEKGTTAHTWEPYTNGASPNPTYPQDINMATGTQEVVVQNTNILDTSEIKVVKNQTGDNRNGYYCRINTTGTYTLILNTTNTMYFGKSTNLESATTLIGSTSATYTTNYTFNEGEYFIIWGTKTDTDKLMVALGTSLPYIEHQEQTKTLHLGDIELAKIGTYQDRIYKNNDKWYIEKNIGKVNLGNIPWTGATTASGYKLYATEQIRDIKYVSANTIVGEGLAYNYIMHAGNGMSHPSALNCIAIDTNAVRVQTTSQAPTGIFYYALATPTTTEITDSTLISDLNALQHLKQYDDTTIITIDDIREYQVTLESDRIVVIENEQVEQNDRIAELEEENSYLSSIVDQIIPKETAEGSSITLDNTLQGKLKLNERKGDTQQDTYEGYNLFTTKGNVDGVTIGITKKSISESEILFNGTTSQAENIIYKNDVFTLPSGTYTMKVEVDTSKFTRPIGTDMAIYLRNTSDNANIYETTLNLLINNSGTYIKTFTLSADTNIRFQVYTNATGIVFNNASFKFTLVSGSETKPYEQYVGGTASPNPTYPQDINVATGTQEVVVQNKNLISGIELGGYSNTTGIKIDDSTTYRNTEFIPIIPSTTYTFSINGTTQGINKFYYDKNKNFISRESNTNATFTTPDNAYYLNIFRGTSLGNTGWQVELGSTATPYTPYQEQTKTLHLGDIELAKIGTYQDRISKSSGKQLFNKNDYTKGFYFNSNGEIVSGANWGYAYVPCEPNTTYIASGMKNYSTPSFIEVDENKNFVANLFNKTGESSKTFTTTTGKYIGVSFVWNNSANNGGEIDTLMLNKGSTALPYEPYGSDKWYIEKNIGKIEIDNTYTWTRETNSAWASARFTCENLPSLGVTTQKDFNYGFCNYGSISATANYITYLNAIRLRYINNKNRIDCMFELESVNELNTLLTDNSMIIYYQLATPTYTEITNTTLIEELNELEKMYSYSGQTNISVSGNLPMIINITALKNLS